jgi:hypothetical protein
LGAQNVALLFWATEKGAAWYSIVFFVLQFVAVVGLFISVEFDCEDRRRG